MGDGAVGAYFVEFVEGGLFFEVGGPVLKDLRGIYALEFLFRELLPVLELLAQAAGERTVADFPELIDTDFGRVELEGRAHGGEQRHGQTGGVEDEVRLGRETVDGVYHEIVVLEMETVGGVRVIDLRAGDNLGVGVDGEESPSENIDLQPPDSFGRGLHLPVEVGDVHGVAVHEGEMPDAAAHEAFGAPAAYTAHAEEDDSCGRKPRHRLRTEQPLRAVEHTDCCLSFVLHR